MSQHKALCRLQRRAPLHTHTPMHTPLQAISSHPTPRQICQPPHGDPDTLGCGAHTSLPSAFCCPAWQCAPTGPPLRLLLRQTTAAQSSPHGTTGTAESLGAAPARLEMAGSHGALPGGAGGCPWCWRGKSTPTPDKPETHESGSWFFQRPRPLTHPPCPQFLLVRRGRQQ